MNRSARVALAAALVLAIGGSSAGSAAAASVKPLREQPPAWMTKKVRDRISAAGTKGVHISTIRAWVRAGMAGRKAKEEPVTEPCNNGDPRPGVNAGACQVYPYGCTANFIFHKTELPFTPTSDGRHHFIGIAGHCVDHANQPSFMEVANGVVANIGVVQKILAGDIGRNGRGEGGLGNDYAIIRIHPGFPVNPDMPAGIGGGPEGIYVGCEPQSVRYWGHGYAVAVGPGKPEGGLATNWFDRGFGWTGGGFPGDSGAGVMIAGGDNHNQAAGDLTHLVVGSDKYPGSVLVGTRVTRALTWMGGDFYLVNQDRTYSRATMADTPCQNANSGAGGGGPASVLGLG
jgi:hypothetical protein